MDDNFLINFVRLSKGTEIPEIFAFWSGVSAISAMLGRRVFLDMGPYTIFPNFYTILVAPSGRFRKSSAIRMASELLKLVKQKPNLISQKITTEALIGAMRSESNIGTTLGVPSCTGFLVVDELSTFLNRKSYETGLGSALIEFFDCSADYEYHTKSRGVERLEYPCLGLLSASTVDWIRDAIPIEAVGGGLTSRCIFVYVESPPPPIARTFYDSGKLELKQRLIEQLEVVGSLSGPATLSDEAWAFYEEEYLRFYNGATELWNDKYVTGYAARRHIHWLKLSIIFAAAEAAETRVLTVSLKHLRGALLMLQHVEKHMKMVMSLITASEMGGNISRVEDFVRNKKIALKKDITRAFVNILSARQLAEVLDTLVATGSFEVGMQGKDVCYVYKQ